MDRPDVERECHTVAVGVVVENGLTLVARRAPHAHQGGTWEFPGGKVKAGETCEEALRREIHEEIGVRFDAASEFHQLAHRYPDRTVRLTFFLCTGLRSEPRGKENQELRWVDGDELEQLPTPEANRSVIERLAGMLHRKEAPP